MHSVYQCLTIFLGNFAAFEETTTRCTVETALTILAVTDNVRARIRQHLSCTDARSRLLTPATTIDIEGSDIAHIPTDTREDFTITDHTTEAVPCR